MTYQEAASPTGWMTLQEAADWIGKPRSWMYDNVLRLGIPHVKLERQYRFHVSALDEWMHSRMVAGSAA